MVASRSLTHTLGLNDRSAGTSRSFTARRKSARVPLYPAAVPLLVVALAASREGVAGDGAVAGVGLQGPSSYVAC